MSIVQRRPRRSTCYRCLTIWHRAWTGPRSVVACASRLGRRSGDRAGGSICRQRATCRRRSGRQSRKSRRRRCCRRTGSRLTGFCASYYQAPLGEVSAVGPAAGPKRLRSADAAPAEGGERLPPPSPEPGIDRRAGGGDRCRPRCRGGFKPFLLFRGHWQRQDRRSICA